MTYQTEGKIILPLKEYIKKNYFEDQSEIKTESQMVEKRLLSLEAQIPP